MGCASAQPMRARHACGPEIAVPPPPRPLPAKVLAIANYSQLNCRHPEGAHAAAVIRHRDPGAGLAPGACWHVALRGLRVCYGPIHRAVMETASRLSGTRLPDCGRVYGPRQLGDVACGWVEVRLRAALDCSSLQHHGDRAAGALHAVGHWRRSRPGTGVSRRIPARGVDPALGRSRDRDLRHRSRGGDRHCDRAQSPVRDTARNWGSAHSARRVRGALNAAARVSLGRGLHRRAACRDRGVLCNPDRDGQSRLGRGAARVCADERHHQ